MEVHFVKTPATQMRPAYLEAFLQRDPPKVEKYQLLWQFYVKDGQSLKAAEVLGALAESVESVSCYNTDHSHVNDILVSHYRWPDVSSTLRWPLEMQSRILFLSVA